MNVPHSLMKPYPEVHSNYYGKNKMLVQLQRRNSIRDRRYLHGLCPASQPPDKSFYNAWTHPPHLQLETTVEPSLRSNTTHNGLPEAKDSMQWRKVAEVHKHKPLALKQPGIQVFWERCRSPSEISCSLLLPILQSPLCTEALFLGFAGENHIDQFLFCANGGLTGNSNSKWRSSAQLRPSQRGVAWQNRKECILFH